MPLTATMKSFTSFCLLTLLVAVCGCPTDEQPEPYDGPAVGLLDDQGVYPYPSVHLMTEDSSTATGWRLNYRAELMPIPDGGTPLPVERTNRLDGVSVANTSVVLLPGADIDPGILPTMHDLSVSMEVSSPVQIIDLESNVRVPCFAEYDAHPDADSPETRVLLIRPMTAMAWGTHHAVVLTDTLVDASGATVPTPERFAALRDGGDVHPGLAGTVDHYESLFALLENAGLAREELVLAWDFWTGTEDVVHAPLDLVIETTRAYLPADPQLEPNYVVDWLSDTDEGFELGTHQWRLSQGSFKLANYLGENGMFTLDEQGNPVQQDDADVYYMVMVPPSVHDAPAGSVPVVIFGHGIFASPYVYIGKDTDSESVCDLMDRMGAIVIGTKWRGLTTEDMPDAVRVANDFGQFPLITDKLTQAVGNTLALPRLLKTGFADAPVFQAFDGSGSMVDTERIYWYGISTGGIEGAVTTANSEHLEFATLHVGGSIWSTMLERSSNWRPYESWIEDTVPAPADRQLLYAVSQLMWDPVDPITHVGSFAGKSMLLQESMGDEQVPNMTTEALARAAGWPMMEPSIEAPYGIEQEPDDLGPGSSALMQYDPQLGRQEDTNRPAWINGAHGAIRGTDEVMSQIEAFFADGQEGTIIHPCGEEPCVFDP